MRGRALALVLLAASSASAAVPDGVAPAFLVPVIGGKAKADPLTFWQQDGQWFADPATWREVGLQLPAGQTQPMSAQTLGVGFVVDEATATVALDLPADRLNAQRVARDRTERGPIAPPAPGVLVNYSVAGMVSEQQQALSLGHEVRKAGRWGVVSTSGQVNTDASGAGYVRGVTRWQKDDPNRLVTYQAGDVFAGPSSSPVNLGGVRVAKDPRALDPLTPTYPVPVLGGVALDPATVEVLANRARVLQGRVGKGPFTADGGALGTGAQQTQVVVRDPYGRETVVSDQRFYVAPTLLRKGLTTWEIAAGRVRQGESDYGTLGATGSVAWGLNDRWTLRSTAQTSTDGKANVALGATTVLGTYGTLDMELGTSKQGGQRQAVAYDYLGPRFGVRLEHERQQDYWRLRAPGALEVEQRTRGSVFWRPTPQWSLRASYSDVRTPRFRTAYADAGLTWRGNGHTVAVSALRDLELKETRVEVGYSYDFGRGKGVSVRARQAPDATAWAVQGRARPTVLGTPVGLSASVDEGAAGQTARANANWTTRAGWAQINAEHGPSGTWASGSMAGAVHLDRKGVTFLGPAESFAVVDVPGQAGVPVRVGGRLVGKTNAQGRLVVGEVTPMVPTEVRVDDRALPLGTQLAEIEQTATAGRQAGMHLTFPVLTETARTFRLTGAAIEAGTVAKTANETTQVGYDGVLYLEQPRPGQTVDVEGVCKAQLPADLGAAQTVAEVACR